MLLTKQILENHRACDRGMLWYTSNGEPASVEETIEKLLAPKAKLLALNGHEKRFDWSNCSSTSHDWSNWLLSRVLPLDDKIRYAIFAAELALDIFEKEFPEDKRPRNAIKSAREYLSNKDGTAAGYADYAERAAAYADRETYADAATYADRAACEATRAARAACADDADNAADYAYYAVVDAVYAVYEDRADDADNVAGEVARAADEAYVSTYTKIINYGLSLVKKCDDCCCKPQD